MRLHYLFFICLAVILSCKKSDSQGGGADTTFSPTNATVDDDSGKSEFKRVKTTPVIKISFDEPLSRNSVPANVDLHDYNLTNVPVNFSYTDNDSTLVITPISPLKYLTIHSVQVRENLTSSTGKKIDAGFQVRIITEMDSSNKFPIISDDALLDSVQRRTFRYFWEFGHPISGMARERNTSGDLVTSGGTGFGIMAIVASVDRGFISRADGGDRLKTIVDFLTNKAVTYHGAFPHWMNGATGATIPFSPNDDGADLVETSYLMEGLLCARQYFNQPDPKETDIRTKINALFNSVEWDWFRQGGQNVLYWHWSPTQNWIMNVQVRGWNEALITYVMAASSTTHTIDATVYENGWAGNGGIRNGGAYYGYTLPLGPYLGGPLFFEHYSFMGINPNGLTNQYANYQDQTKNHSLINYQYCVNNPLAYYGYSDSCWGLTASDSYPPINYTAHAPDNDKGVISPTAALSSFPYSPAESMKALRFFYYTLGDRIWKDYGFVDAFSLDKPWFADSFLAIDQGPIIVMIENYRTGLMWNLFTSCPEVKAGLTKLGFHAPYL